MVWSQAVRRRSVHFAPVPARKGESPSSIAKACANRAGARQSEGITR
ncbi:hypothetical protein KPSA1_01036 [Pseudomonas syringae pv. actinidiae]|uniref:Uncharacterized protein n=1 Tax=Pseudomonas syringae pv. actinidiae TaxID=103796 RepID=A0A2V0Q4W4_PSESF|nr:hypothetical protein KPSA1_01036 [Pseudomonas syringae pv. actinidiae]